MAPDPDLHYPVPLDLSLSHKDLSKGRLVDVARRHDIVVGTFTDEEMVLCGDDADSEGDPHWTPHLHRMAADEVDVAKRACIRLLLSRALLAFGDDGAPVFQQPHATLVWAVGQASALVTWRTDVRDEGTAVGGTFVLPHGLALHDDISAEPGLHELVLRPQHREAAWLAAMLDPTSCSTATFDPEVAATVEELAPRVAELAGRARSSTVMAAAGVTADGGEEQAVTAYGTGDGLWLFQGRRGTEAGAVLQRLGNREILAAAAQLLSLGDSTPRERWRRLRR